jgi:D-arabinose 1-dehydrogenase-like Zn-dependent alcohol dehydrogenase
VFPDTKIHRIPDELDLDIAGPFMCAGQTVFAPLIRYGVKKGDRVGVIGIGGLGHLAIQYAAALGAEVVAISGSESKKEEATKLGATEFWLGKDLKEGKKPGKGLDYLLVTTATHPDWGT